MNVLHIIGGGDAGGAKTHVLSLLKGLLPHAGVLLVSLREGPFAEEARALGIPTEVVSTGNIAKDFKQLRLLYRKGGFDIVHCHGAKGNMMGALLKAFLGAEVVTTVHSDYRLDYMGRPLGNLTYGTINKIALRLIKTRICVSDPVAELLIRRGFSPYGLFSIYNGLDFRLPERSIDRYAYLSALGLSAKPGDVVCGIAARLDPVKDLPTLLRAFQNTPPHMKLIIAGDGDQGPALKALAAELSLGARVCFAGWVDDMDGFYRSIDINLLTSLSETFPYAVTEGARCRLATISSRVGGIPLLIDHGVNGFLFDPGDTGALSSFLSALGSNAALREAFGRLIYEKAAREFSIEATIARQLEIYGVVLRRKAGRTAKRQDVTICGAYGKDNAGDDAILEAIVSEMREIDPDLRIRVLSRTPDTTRLQYRVDSLYTFNLPALAAAFSHSRLYINGGGNLMQDITSTRSLFFYLFTIAFGRLLGCRVMMYGCGIGPIGKPMNRRITRAALNACVDAITLRETVSAEELRRLGVERPEIVLAADPALMLTPLPDSAVDSAMLAAGLPPQGDYLCFALRHWPSFPGKAEVFGRAADYAQTKYGLTPVFLPIERRQDAEAAALAAAHMKTPFHIVRDVGQARAVIGMLSRMKVVVSMRLHGLIFAAGQGVPLVGVAYDLKVSSFLKYMGQDLCTRIEDVTYENLTALIDEAVRKERCELSEAVARLRQIEYKNRETARTLLGLN